MRKLITFCLLVSINISLMMPVNTHFDPLLMLTRVLHQQEVERLSNAEFSPENLYRYLIVLGVESPEVVMRQARLESSHFKSPLFRRSNNLFGMHLPRIRKTTAKGFTWGDTGRKSKMCIYDTWQDSVKDYLLWVGMHEGKDKSDYYAFLVATGYCELEGEYIELLKQIEI